ncbi:MAG: hypothetical protein ACYCOR_09970 [Acidobacteriaceae bacterium]
MSARQYIFDSTFIHDWEVEILERPPLIFPVRQYVYPKAVEEVERGALQILLRSRPGAEAAMATFALGFADPSLPHGVWSCPNPRQLCAIAGGYAFIVDTENPEQWLQIPYRPVAWVHAAEQQELLLFASFHRIWALSAAGKAWETDRLSWEGLRVTGIEGQQLRGFGWDMNTDTEVPFAVDLATGQHIGGAGPSTGTTGRNEQR